MEQDRKEVGSPKPKLQAFGGSNLPESPDIGDVLKDIDDALGGEGVMVISGASDGQFPNLVGKTVGQARRNLTDSLSIHKEAVGVVNGKDVNEEYVLTSTDTLEFIRPAGVKGG